MEIKLTNEINCLKRKETIFIHTYIHAAQDNVLDSPVGAKLRWPSLRQTHTYTERFGEGMQQYNNNNRIMGNSYSSGNVRRLKGQSWRDGRVHSNCMAGLTVLGVFLLVLLNIQKWGGDVGSKEKYSDSYSGEYERRLGDGGKLDNTFSSLGQGADHGGNVLDTLGQRDILKSTLVLYVYNAQDEEQERSFAFFLRYGLTEHGPTYRIIITDGPHIKAFPRLPSLPKNAQYLKTSLCTTTWGAIDAVSRALNVQEFDYFVIIDSHVRGPFLPSYVSDMHWTEAFTRKLVNKVKMVGSIISCEGAPKEGNASGEWRGNPYIKSHAWATDAEGFARLVAQQGIFRCHKSKWDTRYYSDAGAALTILKAGWSIDTLMSRYQGVDWSLPGTWQCNQRVPPDLERHYDGISINPYEVLFVPIKSSYASSQWSFVEMADRYEKWLDLHLRKGDTEKEIQSNAWISKHWTYKQEKLVSMNSRGPDCFDFEYYFENNPGLETMQQDEMALWEHFLLIGQFQGKKYRFTCPLQVGNSYRIAYVLSRGPRCFDHEYYAEQHADLKRAGFNSKELLFEHFAEFGQFEKRKVRFTCADTMEDIPRGFDNVPTSGAGFVSRLDPKDDQQESERKAAIQRAAMLRQRGDANDELTQAVKGALVEEAAKDIIKLKSRGKLG